MCYIPKTILRSVLQLLNLTYRTLMPKCAASCLSVCPTQALDKMEKDWSTVAFDIVAYKDTGTYVLKSPEEASQLLDDHIVMTQSMSFSPYKKAFEERISSWESKLRMTQVHKCTHTHTRTHAHLLLRLALTIYLA